LGLSIAAGGRCVSNITLEDVARQAGVSRSTVSRVVNAQPNVRDDVRTRVKAVIQDTGYLPHAAARTLASQRSWMLGLVLPRSVSSFFADPYFPRLTQGIAQACNQFDYTLSLFLVESKDDEEKIFSRVSRTGLLDGMLVQSGQIGDQLIDRLVNSKIPVLIIGRPFHTQGVSYIDVDNVDATYNAVRHLILMGRQRIGTITGSPDSTVTIDRKEGYLTALLERGLEVDEALIAQGDFSEAGGYYAMQQLLDAKADAVFAASDTMALGAMRLIRERGLSIPQDIAVIGFDDLPQAAVHDPPLTTVRQPITQFGFRAVEILIDLINNGIQPPHHLIMATELVIRESCGFARRK
jgi:LacI family transcriptional regulator